MSISLHNVLGAMPLVEGEVEEKAKMVLAYAAQAVPYLQQCDLPNISKYHFAVCLLVNRQALYPFMDSQVVDQMQAHLFTMYNTYCQMIRADPRFSNAWTLFSETPGV
jgi:hypothetical protein